jgi:hypothetical protein
MCPSARFTSTGSGRLSRRGRLSALRVQRGASAACRPPVAATGRAARRADELRQRRCWPLGLSEWSSPCRISGASAVKRPRALCARHRDTAGATRVDRGPLAGHIVLQITEAARSADRTPGQRPARCQVELRQPAGRQPLRARRDATGHSAQSRNSAVNPRRQRSTALFGVRARNRSVTGPPAYLEGLRLQPADVVARACHRWWQPAASHGNA